VKTIQKIEDRSAIEQSFWRLEQECDGFLLASSSRTRSGHSNMIQTPRALGRIISEGMTLLHFVVDLFFIILT
jgi:hypothetical protein